VLRLFGGERKSLRSAMQSYSAEEVSLFENLKHGILLGSEKMSARLRRSVGGEPDVARPQKKLLLNTKSVSDQAGELAALMGLERDELESLRKPIRRRIRPMRDTLIYLVWRNSNHSLQSIGEYFHVKPTSLSAAKTRGKESLDQNRSMKARIRKTFLM
jgi:hypothetical protein